MHEPEAALVTKETSTHDSRLEVLSPRRSETVAARELRFTTTVDGRNIQTLSTMWTPSTPKLNVGGLARMFRRMDETNQTLETKIQSSYVQH